MSQIQSFSQTALRWLSRSVLQKGVPYAADNAYLEGPYAPVLRETTATALRVTGKLPAELEGRFVRIGPNPIRVRNPGAYHWFSGDGMVHALRLGGGRAHWYRNRWVGTDTAHKALGRRRLPGPRNGVFGTVNTNLIGHAGRLWALNEAGSLPVELDDSIESVRHALFLDGGARAFTAHPHADPDTGELHAICYKGGPSDVVHHLVVDARGQLVRMEPIPLPGGAMIHDCAITPSWVLVFDLPVRFSGAEFLRGSEVPYRWDPKYLARVGLLPRAGAAAQVRWCPVDPCFVYHACNAFESADGSVTVDVVVHERTFAGPRVRQATPALSFERWRLNGAGPVVRKVLSDRDQEFPRFDERLTGKPYRHAYTVGYRGGSTMAQPLLKYDLHSGACVAHDYGSQRITGEAVFVPRHATAAEDDGWLLSYVYDLAVGTSDLVILNAADVGGSPQAVVHLPVPVPMGFHSNWIPG